jgi:hypothetical protein
MDECEEKYVTETCLSLLGACVHSDGQWWTDVFYGKYCSLNCTYNLSMVIDAFIRDTVVWYWYSMLATDVDMNISTSDSLEEGQWFHWLVLVC